MNDLKLRLFVCCSEHRDWRRPLVVEYSTLDFYKEVLHKLARGHKQCLASFNISVISCYTTTVVSLRFVRSAVRLGKIRS